MRTTTRARVLFSSSNLAVKEGLRGEETVGWMSGLCVYLSVWYPLVFTGTKVVYATSSGFLLFVFLVFLLFRHSFLYIFAGLYIKAKWECMTDSVAG